MENVLVVAGYLVATISVLALGRVVYQIVKIKLAKA